MSDNTEDNKPDAHTESENNISLLYQKSISVKRDMPSAELDAVILNMAKETTVNVAASTKVVRNLRWQWPISLAASVCFISVLYFTQMSHFYSPEAIPGEDRHTASDGQTPKPLTDEPVVELKEVEISMFEIQEDAQLNERQRASRYLATKARSKQEKELQKNAQMGLEREHSIVAITSGETEDKTSMKNEALVKLPIKIVNIAQQLRAHLKHKKNNVQMTYSLSAGEHASLQESLFNMLLEFKKANPGLMIESEYYQLLNEKQRMQLGVTADGKKH